MGAIFLLASNVRSSIFRQRTVCRHLEQESSTRVPLKIEDWLTVLIMGALALITFANVLVRYFTDASFAWTEEVSVFLMIVLAMVAGSAAVARNRHIRIEYFADSGPLSRQRARRPSSARPCWRCCSG